MPAIAEKEPVSLAEFAAAEESKSLPAAESAEATPPVADTTPEVAPEVAKDKETLETPETKPAEAVETETEAEGTAESIREWLKENLDFEADTFKTDEEAVKGLREKLKLATRHDEDAAYGKKLRELVGDREEEIVNILQGKTPPEPSPNGKPAEPPPFDPAWEYQIAVDGDGNWVPAKGAPADVVGKYRNYLTWEKQQLREMVRDPQKFLAGQLKQIEEQAIKKATEAVESRSVQESIGRQLREWEATNLADIYANGKDYTAGLTPIGERIAELAAELAQEGIADPIKRLNRAKSIATAEQPKVANNGKLKKLPTKGVRQPAIAAPPAPKQKTDAELFDEGKSLVDVFKLRLKEERAAAGEL